MSTFFRKAPQALRPSAEMNLLRLCARLGLGQGVKQDIRNQVEIGINWVSARALAHHHRLLPTLYRGLMGACPEEAPFEVLAGLRRDYQANAARNVLLTQELLKVLDFFESHGIQAIPFKGPALAEQYYGDLAMRQFDDLDVLIRQGDVPKARDLLMRQGFEPEFACVRVGDPQVLWEEGEYRFFGPEGRYLLEVHWQAVPRTFLADLKYEPMWERHIPAELRGRRVWSLSPEDTLLLLALHGMHHLWDRLAWIQDVVRVARAARGMDWAGLFDWARHIGALRMVEVALLLGHRTLHHQLPESIVEQCERDRTATALTRQFEASWAQLGAGDRRPTMLKQHTRARERWRDKRSYVLGQFFAPSFRDWSKRRLPGRLSFLYRVFRPLRQMREWFQGSRRAKTQAGVMIPIHGPCG